MRLALALLIVTLAAGPALAAATDWQDIGLGVKARLISSDRVDDGVTMAGLDIELPFGTKTYWYIPGETGIPPQLDFSASKGVSDATPSWPYPVIDTEGGYRDYVYRGHLVVPVRLSVSGTTATLALTASLGVCSDVCVPARASFSLPLAFGKEDEAQSLRLAQAWATVPMPWDGARPAFAGVTVSRDGKALLLRSPDAAVDPSSVIADTGDPSLLFDSPQKSPEAAIWALRRLDAGDRGTLLGHSVRLTFMTPRGPYTVDAVVSPTL